MDKYKSFFGTLLIMIILLNFVSVCATYEGSKKKCKPSESGGVPQSPDSSSSPSSPPSEGGPSEGGPPASPPRGGPSEGGAPTGPGGVPSGNPSAPGETGPGAPSGNPSAPGGTGPGGAPSGNPPAPGGTGPGGAPSGNPPAPGGTGPGGAPSGNPPAPGGTTPGGAPSGNPPAPGGATPGGTPLGNPPVGGTTPGGATPPAGGTTPGGSNSTVLAYVLFSSNPNTTSVGRPEVKGLISLFQPPNGNTVVTGQIGVLLNRTNGNYSFAIKDSNGTVLYDLNQHVNPLFIGQASSFSFTWNFIRLTGPNGAIGKYFVVTESNGTLVNAPIVEEFVL